MSDTRGTPDDIRVSGTGDTDDLVGRIRRICLPPFRHLLDRLPALHISDIYDDPFEPYLHQQTTAKTWDTDHFTAIARKRGG
ncbi:MULTISPECIES: hypothetical protein [Streptomyces]|uniref:Uncharacterized protein n=1 Tax=Streptomyces fimbriatus TaxID=68197 RepID=A0ABW0DG57_STRFI